jgi:hypothetical protein
MKKQISKHELRAIIMSTINDALLNGHDFHINIDDLHDRAWDSLKDIEDVKDKKSKNCGNCIDYSSVNECLNGKDFPNCWRDKQ